MVSKARNQSTASAPPTSPTKRRPAADGPARNITLDDDSVNSTIVVKPRTRPEPAKIRSTSRSPRPTVFVSLPRMGTGQKAFKTPAKASTGCSDRPPPQSYGNLIEPPGSESLRDDSRESSPSDGDSDYCPTPPTTSRDLSPPADNSQFKEASSHGQFHAPSPPTPSSKPSPIKEIWALENVPTQKPEISVRTDEPLDQLEESILHIATLEAGMGLPWGDPSDDLVHSVLDSGDGDSDTFDIADWRSKISYHLAGWRVNFASVAVMVLGRFIEIEASGDVNKPEVVRKVLQRIWQPVGTTRPLWWKQLDASSAGKVTKLGRLQHQLVIEVFSTAHFADYMTGPDLLTLSKYQRPRGAYLLSVQALEHAVKAWETGVYVDNSAEFKVENYGDHLESKPLFDVLHPRASFYLNYIDKFSNDTWTDIFGAAATVMDRGRMVIYTSIELDMSSD